MKRINLILSLGLLISCEQVSTGYSVVHGWPKLPKGFILGQVSGVEVDSHDHVFTFHRGKNAAYLGSDSEFQNIQEPTILMLDNNSGALYIPGEKMPFLRPMDLPLMPTTMSG